MTSEPIRLVVIDDHPVYREGLSLTLSVEPDLVVVGEGASAGEAVKLARELRPDVMLLDLDIPGGGLSALPGIAEASPNTRVIVLTASAREEDVTTALRNGASGYALKDVASPELAQITRFVLRGQGYVPPALAAHLLTHGSETQNNPGNLLASLSERERHILNLVAEGQSNKQIADALGITEKTIKNNMTVIMQKLQVRNRVEAALVARRALRR
jgi:two-component system, NarL family, nitrate/nitrite response regulator NarL